MKQYDLIVIGAGSGLDVAVAAAEKGLKTALIEEGPLGGTCLNRGCLPSKMIIHSADLAEEIKKADLFGLKALFQGVNFQRVVTRASNVVDADAQSIERSLRRGKNPVLYKARAKFVAPYTLEVGKEKIKGKKIVIAAGARPSIPPIPGLDKVPYLTSTEALRLTKLPKSLVIIGGGYIAAELGHFYAALGCTVTIIQRGPLLIPREDKEMAELFTKLWKEKYGVICNCAVVSVEEEGGKIVVHTKQAGQEREFRAEKLLIATGVKPNSDRLEVAKTGVKINEKGFIKLNRYLDTSAKNIWALGDIAGVYLFKHAANLEAEYVLNAVLEELGKKKKWAGKKRQPINYYPMPHAIFTSPQIAGVGLTEQDCQQQKRKYVVGKYYYAHTGMGAALEEKEGLVKFIVAPQSKEILGCHILGPEASTLIHEVVVVMKADRFKALEILRTAVHIHPALSEVVQRAALSVPV